MNKAIKMALLVLFLPLVLVNRITIEVDYNSKNILNNLLRWDLS